MGAAPLFFRESLYPTDSVVGLTFPGTAHSGAGHETQWTAADFGEGEGSRDG